MENTKTHRLSDDLEAIGATLVAACHRESDDATIVYAVANPASPQPFATFRWSESSGFFWGHYFDNADDARTDFDARCKS
jgi:hypothetical protein